MDRATEAVKSIAQVAADIEKGRECSGFSDRDKLNFLFGWIKAEARGVAEVAAAGLAAIEGEEAWA